jgi:DNA topoisomerase IB
MPRLRRVDCSLPGFSRRQQGRGFEYRDEDGRTIDDPGTIERIRQLAIPPAWTDVWICADPWGHLQATGIDAAARKQYLYHERWRARRDREKFDRMLEFAEALPLMRERIDADLGEEGLGRKPVLAAAARLLDLGFFRIGSEVARYLGNTPAICRTSYIDPRVVDLFKDGVTSSAWRRGETRAAARPFGRLGFAGRCACRSPEVRGRRNDRRRYLMPVPTGGRPLVGPV